LRPWACIGKKRPERKKAMAKKKVLVIDDEQIVLNSVEKILGQGDYEVEATLSGRQGLEWALSKSYDIVLTDVRMPDMGGMLILRDIKKAKPSMPVIIITGYANVQTAMQAMKLGAAEYIEKPFTPDQLLKAVDTTVSQAAALQTERQVPVHKEEILQVLERAAGDSDFVFRLLHRWADALEEYDLTGPEKLALLTGDIEWIEKQVGPLTEKQKRWLQRPLSAEVLKIFGW
jgi:DNA-binding NtrC family response regulator